MQFRFNPVILTVLRLRQAAQFSRNCDDRDNVISLCCGEIKGLLAKIHCQENNLAFCLKMKLFKVNWISCAIVNMDGPVAQFNNRTRFQVIINTTNTSPINKCVALKML